MTQKNPTRLPAGIREAKTGNGYGNGDHRREVSHIFTVDGNVDDVFGLFDPVSECDWVDDWDPQSVYPKNLSRDEGSVFTLERDGRTAVWTVLRYSPTQHVAEYLVTEYDYQHRWIYVACSAESADTTRVTVRYVITALTGDGQRDIGRYGADFLEAWEAPVKVALDEMVASA